MCESGRTESDTSAAEIGSALVIARTFETKFACVSITPFGSPVVPDV